MLIYVSHLTNRLGYSLNVVFRQVLGLDFTITTDKALFESSDDIRLSYGERPTGNAPFIRSTDLLFSTTIEEQFTKSFDFEGVKALYPTFSKESLLPFDIFAATFYLVSRYEEYLPHHVDEHGRFLSHESEAYRIGMLQKPLVDIWSIALYRKLAELYPDMPPPRRRFEFVTTIDIDAAYSYLHKGLFRTIMGLARDTMLEPDKEMVKQRLRVLTGKERDPFDTFDFLTDLKRDNPAMKLIFFPLMSDYGQYDKPASYANKHFRDLIQHLGDYAKVGIHTSYNASRIKGLIRTETERLAEVLHRPIVRNRFHFLRLQLPKSYRWLLQEGILHDYTMGYADEIGFRSSTTSQHTFYDLERDEETALTIHPFCFMDTTLMRYNRMTPEKAAETYIEMIDTVRNVNGTFIAIWHNQNLCETPQMEGWRQAFVKAVEYGNNQTLSKRIKS